MSEDQQENGNSSGDVPEIELIIKVMSALLSNFKNLLPCSKREEIIFHNQSYM